MNLINAFIKLDNWIILLAVFGISILCGMLSSYFQRTR